MSESSMRGPSHAPTDWRLPRDKINELQQEDIAKLVTMCRQAHFVNIRVRINGVWREFEADWIKHLLREVQP